jgi:hypothetical protein
MGPEFYIYVRHLLISTVQSNQQIAYFGFIDKPLELILC